MNIININSRYELTPWQIAFTEKILCSDRHYRDERNSLFQISKRIPIYLVDRKAFDNVKDGRYFNEKNDRYYQDEENPNKHDNQQFEERPNTELLGYYVSKGAHGIPEIYLCTETIFKHTTNDDELTFLIAKVLIHELAHAYMDRKEYGTRDDFYYWMEESFANEMTLEHFQEFERYHRHRYRYGIYTHNKIESAYEYAKDFILKQPNNYKLGYYLHRNRIHAYVWWRNYKDVINQKPKAKADWLNYVQANIHSGKYDRKILRELTHKVLLEDPYNEMPKKLDR